MQELIKITTLHSKVEDLELDKLKVALIGLRGVSYLENFCFDCLKVNDIYYVDILELRNDAVGFRALPVEAVFGLKYLTDVSFHFTTNGTTYVSAHFINTILGFRNLPKTEPVKTPFHTYLMRDDNTGMYKIGKAKVPKYRERTLQSEKPTIKLLFSCSENIEKKLHNEFEHQRVRGEWFRLDNNDLLFIYEEFKKCGTFKQHTK